ncbi:MAG: hypothetical protein U1D30_23330 [Planctomycetota bacterium]
MYNYGLSETLFDVAVAAFASPTADAGGPYSGTEGTSITLAGGGSGTISLYEWDLDNDGQYDDAVGAVRLLQPSGFRRLHGPVTRHGLVGDRDGHRHRDRGERRSGPRAFPDLPLPVVGQPRTFTLGASDPSSVDQAAGFRFQIDWDGNGTAWASNH